LSKFLRAGGKFCASADPQHRNPIKVATTFILASKLLGDPLRFPFGRHALVSVKAAILLCRPRLLIAPFLEDGFAALWQIFAPCGIASRMGKGIAGSPCLLRCPFHGRSTHAWRPNRTGTQSASSVTNHRPRRKRRHFRALLTQIDPSELPAIKVMMLRLLEKNRWGQRST
jgi:hypothetical protein